VTSAALSRNQPVKMIPCNIVSEGMPRAAGQR
jgi:hypothetical protein